MSLYVATYDMRHAGRRASVARILLTYGHRVQRSVYEVWLEPGEVRDLRREVGPYLDVDDSFHIFPVDERPARTRVSWQRWTEAYRPVILV